MTENKRFNCHVKFSAMPNGIMVLDYERNGDEQTVIEDISREKAHRVMDRLNELNDENNQLKQELFETSKELLWATSDEVDRALHYEDEVEELRKEIFK